MLSPSTLEYYQMIWLGKSSTGSVDVGVLGWNDNMGLPAEEKLRSQGSVWNFIQDQV